VLAGARWTRLARADSLVAAAAERDAAGFAAPVAGLSAAKPITVGDELAAVGRPDWTVPFEPVDALPPPSCIVPVESVALLPRSLPLAPRRYLS